MIQNTDGANVALFAGPDDLEQQLLDWLAAGPSEPQEEKDHMPENSPVQGSQLEEDAPANEETESTPCAAAHHQQQQHQQQQHQGLAAPAEVCSSSGDQAASGTAHQYMRRVCEAQERASQKCRGMHATVMPGLSRKRI